MIRRFLLIIVLMNVVACDEIGGLIIECIFDSGPVFDESSLPNAILNQEYRNTINVSIRFAFDDSYYYKFSHSGELPPGLSLKNDAANRRIIIEGTPTLLGSYALMLKVEVGKRYPGSVNEVQLCNDQAERTYIIDVIPTSKSLFINEF